MKPTPAKRAYDANYRANNREKLRAAQATYRAEHPEEIRAYDAEHKEEHRASNAAWYQDNKEELRAKAARYRADHPEEVRASDAKRRAGNRDADREKDSMWWKWFSGNLNILKQAQGCEDCGTHEGQMVHHHIDPSTRRCDVSQMYRHSLEAFIDEIAKCTVLCRPCHPKRHARLDVAR